MEEAAFEKMAAGHRLIGFTHYGPFPLYHESYDRRAKGRSPEERWDLVYSCLPTWLNELQKNWDFGKACLIRLAEAGLRVAVAGRAGVPGLPRHPGISYLPQLPWDAFMRLMASARAAFAPNCLIHTPSSSMEPSRPPHRYTGPHRAPQPPAPQALQRRTAGILPS